MMIVIKLCYLLSLAALVKANSVERCPACPACDIGQRSDDLQWSPVPNMALCMYGYDPFQMDRFTEGKPDPGVKKRWMSLFFSTAFWIGFRRQLFTFSTFLLPPLSSTCDHPDGVSDTLS